MISLPKAIDEHIRREAERTFPNECCGVLLGKLTPGEEPYTDLREVTDAIVIENSSSSQEQYHRFVIEPEDYLKAELVAAKRGLDLLGFYHSHPEDVARPSEFDRVRALPNLSYIVVSAESGPEGPVAKELTSWELSQDRSQFLSEPGID